MSSEPLNNSIELYRRKGPYTIEGDHNFQCISYIKLDKKPCVICLGGMDLSTRTTSEANGYAAEVQALLGRRGFDNKDMSIITAVYPGNDQDKMEYRDYLNKRTQTPNPLIDHSIKEFAALIYNALTSDIHNKDDILKRSNNLTFFCHSFGAAVAQGVANELDALFKNRQKDIDQDTRKKILKNIANITIGSNIDHFKSPQYFTSLHIISGLDSSVVTIKNPEWKNLVSQISPRASIVSCTPKIEPVYKVQSLTKRGRNYDWHEEAA